MEEHGKHKHHHHHGRHHHHHHHRKSDAKSESGSRSDSMSEVGRTDVHHGWVKMTPSLETPTQHKPGIQADIPEPPFKKTFCRFSPAGFEYYHKEEDPKPYAEFRIEKESHCVEVPWDEDSAFIICTPDQNDSLMTNFIVLKAFGKSEHEAWANILFNYLELPPKLGKSLSRHRAHSQELQHDLTGFLKQMRTRPCGGATIATTDDTTEDLWLKLDKNAQAIVVTAFGGGNKNQVPTQQLKQAKDLFDKYAKEGTIDAKGVKSILKKFDLETSEADINAIMTGSGDAPKHALRFGELMSNFAGFTMLTRVRRLFDKFDTDKSNTIDAEELNSIMFHLGHNPTRQEVADLLKRFDYDNSGALRFNEFLSLYAEYGLADTRLTEDVLRSMFKALDPRSTGFVTMDQVKKILTTVGHQVTDEMIDKVVASTTLKNKQRMNYDEFCRFVHGLL